MMSRVAFVGIGLPKTGTKSLRAAFSHFGMQTISARFFGAGNLSLMSFMSRFERYYKVGSDPLAFDDFPWYTIYSDIALYSPSTYFVLTQRSSPSAWIESYLRWPEKYSKSTIVQAARNYVFGACSPLGNEDQYLRKYHQHSLDVHSFFESNNLSHRLLTLNVEDPQALSRLTGFVSRYLQISSELTSFPCVNQNKL